MDTPEDNFFQVSVKGLHFNEAGELLMIKEGEIWELPGGRIQKGEQFIDCLKREVIEETGIECDVLDKQPSIVYPTIDLEGRPRIMVFYKIKMKSFEITPNSEAEEIRFVTKDQIRSLNIFPQLLELPDFL